MAQPTKPCPFARTWRRSLASPTCAKQTSFPASAHTSPRLVPQLQLRVPFFHGSAPTCVLRGCGPTNLDGHPRRYERTELVHRQSAAKGRERFHAHPLWPRRFLLKDRRRNSSSPAGSCFQTGNCPSALSSLVACPAPPVAPRRAATALQRASRSFRSLLIRPSPGLRRLDTTSSRSWHRGPPGSRTPSRVSKHCLVLGHVGSRVLPLSH